MLQEQIPKPYVYIPVSILKTLSKLIGKAVISKFKTCIHKSIEQFNPGHFIALSHKSQDIIVAIRGTSHLSDVLSDLMGKYEEFQVHSLLKPPSHIKNGFVHSGILKCAQNKCKRFLPILDNLLQVPFSFSHNLNTLEISFL